VKPDIENIRGLNLAAVWHTTFKWQDYCCSSSYQKLDIICCTESGLTEALYILYICVYLLLCTTCTLVNIFYIMTSDLLLQTMTDKRQTWPLIREDARQRQDGVCQTVINIWSWTPRLTDRPTVSLNVTLTLILSWSSWILGFLSQCFGGVQK
jgi:hypothetical protein